MACFISGRDKGYYEGDRVHVLDQEVPQRPSPTHLPQFDVNGLFTGWSPDATLAAHAARVVADEAEMMAATIDAQIAQLLDMTPTEVAASIDTIFNTLNAAQRGVLKRIAILAQLGARGSFRSRGAFKLGG